MAQIEELGLMGTACSLRGYCTGVLRAASLGLITFDDTVKTPASDPFAHFSDRIGWSLKPTNTRPLCNCAATVLRLLADRPSLRILELGPGAGVAAAEIRLMRPDCVLTTIGLTPIDPFRMPASLGNHALDIPFIDRQFVGDLWKILPLVEGPFDFIYDNYGAIFWVLLGAARQGSAEQAEELISDVLQMLDGDGLLFVGASDGRGLLERSLSARADPSAVYGESEAIYSGTEIRRCVLAKGTSRSILRVGCANRGSSILRESVKSLWLREDEPSSRPELQL